MRFSLVVVGALAGLATALPQRAIANGKSRVGRPDGQNNQNNAAQPSQPPQAVSTGTPNAQAPAAAAPNGKGNGAQSGNQNTPTGAANNQPAQNTPAAGNNNGNGKNNGNNGNGKNNGNNNGNNGGNGNNGANNGTSNGNNGNNNGNNGNGQNQGQNGAFNAALVPEFGVQAGQQPDGTGNCIGIKNVKIPCSCPPDRQDFIQKVSAAAASGQSEGVPINFPTDNSNASEKARIGASVIVLQNLNGKGKGCPAAATTFLAQQAAL
jgi:hypothetical protein